MLNNPTEQFRAALADAGVHLAADARIIPDGTLRRARAADDKPGSLSIWYNFHPDAPASGAAGNWRTGAKLTWCGKRLQALTSAERETLRLRIEQDRKRAQAETERRHSESAAKASSIWKSATPADITHPYLVRKGIVDAGDFIRQKGSSLILPIITFERRLVGLQFIDTTGGKRFLAGMAKAAAFIPVVGLPDGNAPLWITEGMATAATVGALYKASCVIASCDAGNLKSVAMAARAKWPQLEIIVAPDFDAIGQSKGKEAAIAAHAKILPPPAQIPHGCSDWNDCDTARRQEVSHV